MHGFLLTELHFGLECLSRVLCLCSLIGIDFVGIFGFEEILDCGLGLDASPVEGSDLFFGELNFLSSRRLPHLA